MDIEGVFNLHSLHSYDFYEIINCSQSITSFPILQLKSMREENETVKLCCLTVIFNFCFHSSRCFFPSIATRRRENML